MTEMAARQLSHMRAALADFREGKLSLNLFLSILEGAARALSQDFWAVEVFAIALELEQINTDLLEGHRTLSPNERDQVEGHLVQLESRLDRFSRSV